MASERDLELLDDYISNRLSGAERTYIEERLQQDPDLRSEYAIQQQIAAGIRQARVAELKKMLSSIPTPPLQDPGFSAAKIAGLAMAVMLALSLIYYFTRQTPESGPATVEQPTVPAVTENPGTEPAVTKEDNQETDEVSEAEPSKSAGSASKKSSASKPEAKKRIDVFDPSGESEPAADENIPGADDMNAESAVERTDLVVVTDGTSKKYKFHYQVLEDKVVLYGTFEKNLYQILEFISGEKRTIFLYYKDAYYLLDSTGSRVNPLIPVNDPALLKKLRESVR